MEHSDWFEEIIGIPVIAGSGRTKDPEAEITNRIYSLLKFLEDSAATDSAGNLIVEKARRDYKANVSGRALHFYQKVVALEAAITAGRNQYPQPTGFGESVRDYYHCGYYCIFFCCRFFLLHSDRLDTNVHEKIPQHLEKLLAKDPAKQPIIDRLKAAYSMLQTFRNKADYNMASRVVVELSDTDSVQSVIQMVTNLTTDCGVR